MIDKNIICLFWLPGLFTADQNLNKREKAINTRQNPGGTRRGYECPEERDYYPYWHPTPWKDMAILAENQTRCDFYRKESFNVKPKGNKWFRIVNLYPLTHPFENSSLITRPFNVCICEEI